MTEDEIIAKYRPRCIECGDCLLWQGALHHKRNPIVKISGKVQPIRVMMLRARGLKMGGKLKSGTTCESSRCIEPSHVVRVMAETVCKQAVARTGYHLNPARNKKIALSRKHRNKVDEQMRVAILEAQGPQRAIAAKFGVSQHTVSEIKRGERFKDYSSPFAGLIAANDSGRKRA